MRIFLFLCLIKFALARPRDDYLYQQQQNNAAFVNQYTAEQLQMFQKYDLKQQQQQQQPVEQLAEQHFPEQNQFKFYPEIQQPQLQEIELQQQQQEEEQQQRQQFQQLVEQQQMQQFPQQQQLQFYPEIQQLKLQDNQLQQEQQQEIQQPFQQLVGQQQLQQFSQQQQFQFYPQIQQAQLEEIQLEHQQQEQQEKQEQHQQKPVLNVEKASDPLLVSEYANQLVRQAQQLIQYEQQVLQEQHQKQRQQEPITENTSSINQINKTFDSAEQTQNQVFETLEDTQSQQYLQPQNNHQEHQFQFDQQSISFNSIAQPQMEQRLEIPQVPQDLTAYQTTVSIPQQYQTTTQHTQVPGAQAVTYNKEFFYLSAPDDENDDVPVNQESEITQIRKNIRVLFIKAPEENLIEKAALKLAQQSIETQTAIYVLTKQDAVGELTKKLEQVMHGSTHHAKPEVFFVKYKTPEEAEQAQRAIQAEYEALEGTNNYSTEAAPPNQSIVSSAVTTTSNFNGQISPENAYE